MHNIAKSDCSDVKTIQDINDQYDYEDEHSQGEGDWPEVACGQTEKYNELKYIYREKLKRHVNLGTITEKRAIKALCEACRELSNPRDRQEFYDLLAKKLNIIIV